MEAKTSRRMTVRLQESLWRDLKRYAAERDRSMSAVMEEAVRRMVGQSISRREARDRMLTRMRTAKDRGAGHQVTWTRDELHER